MAGTAHNNTLRRPAHWLLLLALLYCVSDPGAFVAPSPRWGRLHCARACQGHATANARQPEVNFSHVHLYVDALRPLEAYKALEAKLNAFATTEAAGGAEAGRAAWLALAKEHGNPVTGAADPASWAAADQDIVEQLLVGLGWRVTGSCDGGSTHTLVVTSPDPDGVRFVVTAHKEHGISQLAEGDEAQELGEGGPDHFHASQLARFSRHSGGRQGIAVLGFTVPRGEVSQIRARYAQLHPKLLVPGSPRFYGGVEVLEVFAYYMGAKCESDTDCGTMLRFVESGEVEGSHWILPGIEKVEARFDGATSPAYSDHWVSNVVSRAGFLDTLEDTLGFTPKADFNAGVVAAGEAQIESTVTGNSPSLWTEDRDIALRDQQQVYLPINNALSEVGHVHLYLEEIGQGVQHIASRVADLPSVVQRANDLRAMTGAGLAFLSIPRSYYGTLSVEQLSKDAQVDPALAEQCISSLQAAGIVDSGGIVSLDATRDEVLAALPAPAGQSVVEHVLRARYRNLYALAGDAVNEETYIHVVRNNILMDVQGDDLLMQIFTRNILQRAAGEEAPFLELIQRVCSQRGKPARIRPGCGGFGIRNFLTLFLSIEASKASRARVDAEAAGDTEAALYCGRMLGLFEAQLDESNPVLTAISDAMAAEGEALERGDAAAAQLCQADKAAGQETLQSISAKYKRLMRELRQGRRVPVAA